MNAREVQWLIPFEDSGTKSLVLFSACDSKYFVYAVSLIRSVDLFSPGHYFVLHLVNPNQSCLDRARQLANSLKDTRLAVTYENIDLTKLDGPQKKAYYASARFPQLAKLIYEFRVPIFSLDADSLVVNPIDRNFSDKPDAEIVLIRRDLDGPTEEHLSVATGSIWFKPTKGVRNFLESVAQVIDERLQNGSLEWFVDQLVFYQEMVKMQREVRFYNLKRKYADWDFLDSSIVWAGKGPRKENDMRFFLLQSLLSDDLERRELANRLWSNLCAANDQLPRNDCLHNRLWIANAEVIHSKDEHEIEGVSEIMDKIVLFIPRLDLPWKRAANSAAYPPLLAEDVLDLRLHWKNFAIRLANAIEHAGLTVDVLEIPAWEIDRKAIDESGAKLALVPHRCRLDFDPGKTRVLFYMQEYFRWVFVLDKSGWSAASSVYPINTESMPESHNDCFNTYRYRLLNGSLGSKFAQPVRKNCKQLITEGSIPKQSGFFGFQQCRPYIFFPLQIPHDQSIRYFSDFSELEVVKSLIDWASKRGVAVVMKPHPANRKSMTPFEALVDGINIFWSEAHVYDLIENAVSVYTINSGVGFETLLHLKPVVTFGRVEYDCVSFKATPSRLDEAWDYCLQAELKVLENRYRCFINWFLGDYAVDMSQPVQASARLEQIAADIITQVRAAKKS